MRLNYAVCEMMQQVRPLTFDPAAVRDQRVKYVYMITMLTRSKRWNITTEVRFCQWSQVYGEKRAARYLVRNKNAAWTRGFGGTRHIVI